MKKAVITGGTGFIGSHLAEALTAQGYEVHIVARDADGPNQKYLTDMTMHAIEVSDTAALEKVFTGASYIFHLVALADQQSIDDPQLGEKINIGGTISALQAARAAGVEKFVFASSASVYGDQDIVPFQEDLPAAPIDPFGLYKYFGECALKLWTKQYGVPTVSLRIFNAYGSRDPIGPDAFVIGRFLNLRCTGVPLTIDGDGLSTRDYIHVDDIVSAFIAAAEHAEATGGEVFNIGSGVGTSLNELAAQIGGPVERLDSRPGFRSGPSHRRADIAKAKKVLGWEPHVTLADGISNLKAELGIT